MQYNSVIFDLGGVIVNLDYQKTVAAFKKTLPDIASDFFLGQEAQLKFFSDYEVGKITTSEFMMSFNQHYACQLNPKTFSECWNAMILNLPLERIELLKKLKAKGKKIYLLSNINELHEKYFEEILDSYKLKSSFFGLFDKVYYSHKVGLRKPSPEIFKLVLSENHLNPAETLFIDDTLGHVQSARELGINAIHLQKNESITQLSILKL